MVVMIDVALSMFTRPDLPAAFPSPRSVSAFRFGVPFSVFPFPFSVPGRFPLFRDTHETEQISYPESSRSLTVLARRPWHTTGMTYPRRQLVPWKGRYLVTTTASAEEILALVAADIDIEGSWTRDGESSVWYRDVAGQRKQIEFGTDTMDEQGKFYLWYALKKQKADGDLMYRARQHRRLT